MAKCCAKCGETKSNDRFNKHARNRDGLQSWCKDCKNDSQRRLRNKVHDAECFCNFCVSRLNAATGLKRCPKCCKSKSRSEFHKGATYCKVCTPRPSAEEARRTHWQKTYRLTERDVAALIEVQGGLCVCGDELTESSLHIDHDHVCCSGRTSCGGCVRGALCSSCNRALGHLKDDPDRALALATYLWRFKSVLNLSMTQGV